MSRCTNSGLASHPVECRTPRNRPGLAATIASSTGRTPSPSFRSAWPMMAAAAFVGPWLPLADSVAMVSMYSTSPTGRISTGPSCRYSQRTSMNTVERTLCPLPTSAVSSGRRYRWYAGGSGRETQKWWWVSQIGRSGSSVSSTVCASQSSPFSTMLSTSVMLRRPILTRRFRVWTPVGNVEHIRRPPTKGVPPTPVAPIMAANTEPTSNQAIRMLSEGTWQS